MVDTVIVALPEENDYVNRISSQKKPHLTLMYLGENLDMDHLQQVVQYLQHIAKTSMHRFGLSVDRRGTLGDKDADVLFFKDGWQTKEIQQIQGWLRGDDAIANAYAQSKQFAKWTPHLTLGYPETPANEDDREYPGIHYVNFDRIAIWTGESEGPEFRLKDYEDLAMSDLGESFAQYFMNEEILEHYGVKGMQWGKRKAESGSAGSEPKGDRGKIRRALTKANTAGKAGDKVIEEGHGKLIFLPQDKRDQVASATKAASLGAAMQINKDPRFKGKDLKRDPELKKAYHDQVAKALKIVYKDALAEARAEVTADAISAVIDARRQHVEMKARQSTVRHADENQSSASLILEFDEDELGQISAFRLPKVVHADTIEDVYSAVANCVGENFKIVVPEDLAHSEEFVAYISSDDEDLMHYGIKGMRWGITKTRTATGVELKATPGKKLKAEGGKHHEPSEDAKAAAMVKQKAKASTTDSLSNAELKKLIERMQLESSYERLAQQERGNQLVKKMFTEPKYRNQQVEGIQKIYKPAKIAVGTAVGVAGLRKGIKNVDLSNLMDDDD